jgi:DnaJ-domain-containing protein 1
LLLTLPLFSLALDDFADSELGAEWKAFKAEAAEIESSINALRQSTSSSDMKRAVTKKRLDAMLDELEERCESLENSLQYVIYSDLVRNNY